MITAEDVRMAYKYESLNRIQKERENTWVAYRNVGYGILASGFVISLIQRFDLIVLAKSFLT